MRIFRQRSRCGVAQAPRHPEVNQKSATGFESHNEILAAALQRDDQLTFELRRDRIRLKRADEPRIADLDVLQTAADQVRLERETNRLDLRHLGHSCDDQDQDGSRWRWLVTK